MERIRGDAAADQSHGKRESANGFLGGITAALRRSISGSRNGVEAPIYDAAVFIIALIFARCHVIFGAYPIAIGAIAVLPCRVWMAVLGAVTGSLTLGRSGVIYAMICAIVAFLRIIISATDKKRSDQEGQALFGESIVLRMSCALIGGFIAALYEILLNSLSLESVLFGAAMIALPPAIAFALSGLFGAGVSPSAIFLDKSEIFSIRNLSGEERNSMIFFRCSVLFGVFLISISLSAYELFGISAGFVFSAVSALFTARRFGAMPGGAVGFISSVGLSGSYCGAFTLAGLLAGTLSSAGVIPSTLLGGVILSVWGGYVGGATGFLTVFPEYAIAAAIAIPLFKKTCLERTPEEVAGAEEIASDMVGTMALSYKSRYVGAIDALEASLSSISRVVGEVRLKDSEVGADELKRLACECINRYFDTETIGISGIDEARETFLGRAESIIPILASGKRLEREAFGAPPHLTVIAGGITEAINRAVGIISEDAYRERTRDSSPEDFEYTAKLLGEARMYDYSEKSANEKLCVLAKDALRGFGVSGFSVQVFGERRPHLIIAMEDESGSVIASPALKGALEEGIGIRLDTPEFYRKGKMALMECSAAPRYATTSAISASAMSDEPSGDTARHFESAERRHFSLISDGMGSGEEAVRTSAFVAEFLARALEFGGGTETALRLLNSTIKRRRKECSATIDLFSVDLVSGEATFHKCGAAPSYIKRGDSLFRIRSKTSPIGLVSELDAERIRVDLEPGDTIIMFSDGISSDGEAPWLLDAISSKQSNTPEAISNAVLSAAKRNASSTDDLTVLVTRVDAIG